jgi:hypothetical protein
MTQHNLGNALSTLGARENGTRRLDEAVAAYCAALQERSRERVPLQCAATRNNIGLALFRLGERENGTKWPLPPIARHCRKEAASACRFSGPRRRTISVRR